MWLSKDAALCLLTVLGGTPHFSAAETTAMASADSWVAALGTEGACVSVDFRVLANVGCALAKPFWLVEGRWDRVSP